MFKLSESVKWAALGIISIIVAVFGVAGYSKTWYEFGKRDGAKELEDFIRKALNDAKSSEVKEEV